MIAAIYARKSTEQHVADDQKSVARQVAHAREFAARHGWTVEDVHVYVDDGISGAEFAARRSYMRMMASLQQRRPFDVLIMSESSRLGREAWETGYALKQLLVAGVRVFFYLENRECTFDHPLDKLQFSIVQAFDEMERTRASQRSIDKALQLARAGYVTGGRVFGYDNVRVDSHTERRINETEAAVVRRMFELAAGGMGQKRIAMQLNDDGVAAPRAQQGRPTGWAQSSVHAVLFRPLYRGEIVWNRTRKRNGWGAKQVRDRAERDWVRHQAPALRIVSEELWAAAHGQIAAARAAYHVATKGLRGGRPAVDSNYLLPGLARCAVCSGGLMVRTGSGAGRRRAFSYCCSGHHNRGRAVCKNAVQVDMQAVDRAVLQGLGEVLTPDLVEDVVARVRELVEGDRPRHGEETRRSLAAAEAEVERYAAAIAIAGDVTAVVRRLQEAEERRQALAARLRTLEGGPRNTPIAWADVESQVRACLADWRSLMARHIPEARQLLRQVLVAPLQFTPFAEGRRKGYRFSGNASIAGLLEGVVALECCRGKWRPHRDSNPGFSLERAAS
jgi:site-specific DNA recombinase